MHVKDVECCMWSGNWILQLDG